MVKIINGKKIAAAIEKNIQKEVKKIEKQPKLAVILVGNDPASCLYVSLKEQAAKRLGIGFAKYIFSSKTAEDSIALKIKELNHNREIDGIMVQLPLPPNFSTQKIIKTISAAKDVDGLKNKNITPPTIKAILEALKATEPAAQSSQTLIVVKNKKFAERLKQEIRKNFSFTKITAAQPRNKNLAGKTKKADILISIVGQPAFITKNMVKKNATVIDVGISRKNKSVKGDADFENLKNEVRYVTPVPGGIGPLTVAFLMKNTLELLKKHQPRLTPPLIKGGNRRS